jgi:lipopolysaccharide/colanic/teichoic acid biosynthesis glycosyltransferase
MGKRVLDIAVAATVLVLLLPVLAVVALAIVLESGRPIFYRAPRVGHRGRPLRMLKFRKMRVGAAGDPLTAREDERFTRIGALLARTRLDELPQFWHVLRGEMSLIGPRPEDPGFVALHRGTFDEILQVRPGMSGLSQLAFADERSLLPDEDPIGHYVERILPQKCALDRLYARSASVRMDVRVALWTLVAVGLRQPVAVNRRTGATTLRRRPSHAAAPARPEVATTTPASETC